MSRENGDETEGGLRPGPDPQEAIVRRPNGTFAPGTAGGPGRRRMDPAVLEMAEAATPKAMKRLIEALDATKIVHYKGEEVGEYVDHEMRKRAAEAIFARLYGTPPVAVAFDNENGGGPVGLVFIPLAAPTPTEE